MVVVALRPAQHEPPLTRLGDDALAARVAYGDDAAFALLYARFAPRLRAYAWAIVRDAHEAHDAVQAAMAKALVALRATTLHSRVAPWLFRVVRNEAIDVTRRRRDHASLGAIAHVATEDAAAAVLRREELAELVGDLRALPPGQRLALVARAVEHRPHEEIAGALGTTPAAARQAVYAARVRLRRQSVSRS